MELQLTTVTIDCGDALAVATFWSAALGLAVDDGATVSFASITTPGDQANLAFARVPEAKTTKNRVHLDLAAEVRSAEVERLVALGASRLADHDEGGMRWTTLADVEGNEFCVA